MCSTWHCTSAALIYRCSSNAPLGVEYYLEYYRKAITPSISLWMEYGQYLKWHGVVERENREWCWLACGKTERTGTSCENRTTLALK
jgi:hypothetical protein